MGYQHSSQASYSYRPPNLTIALHRYSTAEPVSFSKLRAAEARFSQKRRDKAVLGLESGLAMFDNAVYEAPEGVVMQPRDATVLLVDTAYRKALALVYKPIVHEHSHELLHEKLHVGSLERPLRVLDMGTGSGCVLLALLRRLAGGDIPAVGVGMDADREALEVAVRNERRHIDRLGDTSCAWCVGTFANFGSKPLEYVGSPSNIAQNMAEQALAGGFDVILSNPPYLDRDKVLSVIDEDVRARDPRRALFCGEGGLQCYSEIARNAPNLLCSAVEETSTANTDTASGRAALVILEIPGNSASKVLREILRNGTNNAVWSQQTEVIRDSRGQQRVLVLTKT